MHICGTHSAVIPDAAKRRSGIHNHDSGLWIPDSRLRRAPGMTAVDTATTGYSLIHMSNSPRF